jgi:small subunit ribosomal protein S5
MENEVKDVKVNEAPAAKAVAPAPVPSQEANGEHRPNSFNGQRRDFHSDRGPMGNGGRRFSHRPPIQKEYEETVVHIGKIAKVVKGGKRVRFSAVAVIGNGKGKYGYGIGKSAEVPEAIKKAISAAHAAIYSLPIVKNDTIPHTVEGNFGACKVFLKPAPAGTGIVAGGPVRAILEAAGVKNVYSKVYGSRAAINVIKATANGLCQLRTISKAQEVLLEEAKAKEAAVAKTEVKQEVKTDAEAK